MTLLKVSPINMRNLTILFLLSTGTLFGQTSFKKYFQDQTMRIDFLHSGNATSENAKLEKVFCYGTWAGNKVNLVDTLNLGKSFYKILDAKSGQVIFSKGYDSYFKDYQSTDAAISGKTKSFYESALLPCPKNNIIFILEKRDSLNHFLEVFRKEINPAEAIPYDLNDASIKVFSILNNGLSENKVDVVFIADGYAKEEETKFKNDLERVSKTFFAMEPLKSLRDKFNIRGVFKPSQESGISEPAAGLMRNTSVNSAFDALGSERYVLTEDIKSLRDIAAYVPYDAIFIMANSNRYGGGGLYNFYCTFTSDNINSDYLMSHEFGHSFFGLADEYYTSSVAYSNFYPKGYEPLESNITANTDSSTLKWKHLLSSGIEIPTPWEKDSYDEFEIAWQKERTQLNEEITRLKKEKATSTSIQLKKSDYDRKQASHIFLAQEMLNQSKYSGKVGLYEGAGYATSGLYRSSVNCIMFTQANYFCPVCRNAMEKMIQWHTGE